MKTPKKQKAQTYGGKSADERLAERRKKLVDAALSIWGDQGWAAVTMRGVCAKAGLIDRYFYESFADRDALLVAVWDQLLGEILAVMVATFAASMHTHPFAQLRGVVAAFVHHVVEDPRRTRIVFGEHAGSAALEPRRRTTLQHLTDLFVYAARPHLKRGVDEAEFRMTVLMAIGGFVELMIAWQAGVVRADPEKIIDHATEVGVTLAAPYLAAAR